DINTPYLFNLSNRQIVILRDKNQKTQGNSSTPAIPKQPKIITGKVVDEKNQPLPGVNVLVQGTSIGTITNISGEFELPVTEDSGVLVFSFVGMKSSSIAIGNQNIINVVLEEEMVDLEEIVVVGYGTQKRSSVVGSFSTTTSEEILKAPVGSVTSALVGRLTGLVTQSRSGQPGGDAPTLRIRGVSTFNSSDPLVIVDGVERTAGGTAYVNDGQSYGHFSGYEQINPNDIESISILKDASATAVYGVKGANGVIIIKTKQGQKGKPLIKFTSNYGLSVPIRLRENLGSYEYGYYANEGNANAGIAPYMSFENMMRYRYTYDPLLYPSMNFSEYTLKDYSTKYNANFSVSGGTEKVNYYTSVGYYSEEGLIKNLPEYGFDANQKYDRFNLRANLDIQFTKRLSGSINVDSRFETRSGPNAPDDASLWWKMHQAHPWASPGFDEEGRLIIAKTEKEPAIFERIVDGGFYQRLQTTANTIFSLKYDMDFITKGLSAQAKYSYDSWFSDWYKATRQHAPYFPVEIDGQVYLRKGRDESELFFQPQSSSKRIKEYFETSLNYSRYFGKHTFTGLALFNTEKRHFYMSTYPEVPNAYLGLVGRLTYNYDSRYFAEFNYGRNGSENFPEGKRFGNFPAYSVGWLMSEENFMKVLRFIDYFKIRGSYGKVGNDRIGDARFLYIEGPFVNYPDGYQIYFGEPGTPTSVLFPIQEGKPANEDVSWEIAHKANLGLDARFFKSRLGIVFDVFKERRSNILITPRTTPWFLFPEMGRIGNFSVSNYLTSINYAEVANKGIELEAEWSSSLGEFFRYFLKGTYTYSINEALKVSEPTYPYPWQYSIGQPLGQYSGLIAEGYFDSYEEIYDKNTPVSTYDPTLSPGDIRYKDINGDMKIDKEDIVRLGDGNLPRSNFTGSIGISWKGFDVSALLQGVTDVAFMPSSEAQIQMNEGWGAYTWIRERWTPQNRDALYPVLSAMADNNNSANNFQPSSYWAYDATYVRLKNIEIGYNLPKSLTNRIRINSIRMYFSGQNLLTWTRAPEMKRYDPEMVSSRQYFHPIMTIYNLGTTITF
ncbi:MAG: TonB-dependent receptor, partial [Bacteroidales bacterium]|nr:TonB-dependent receptor [Bacteroidales bacterium]